MVWPLIERRKRIDIYGEARKLHIEGHRGKELREEENGGEDFSISIQNYSASRNAMLIWMFDKYDKERD
jgi:hypothetical protein